MKDNRTNEEKIDNLEKLGVKVSVVENPTEEDLNDSRLIVGKMDIHSSEENNNETGVVNMKWLVVSSHDERYDFNLNMNIFNGTIEDFDSSNPYGFKKEHREEGRDGSYIYHEEKRTDRHCSGLTDEVWDTLKDKLDVVSFHTIILIPLENLNKDNFYFMNGLVTRNVKFGFLDTKDQNK